MQEVGVQIKINCPHVLTSVCRLLTVRQLLRRSASNRFTVERERTIVCNTAQAVKLRDFFQKKASLKLFWRRACTGGIMKLYVQVDDSKKVRRNRKDRRCIQT